MTPRHLTFAIVACACLSLSVVPNAAQVLPVAVAPKLPPVAVAPKLLPAADHVVLAPVSAAPAVRAPELDPSAPLVDAVVDYLADRSSSLSPGEIVHLARVLVEEARRHDLEAGLVLAVIEVESRFDPFAVSAAGAGGLMQLMPATARSLAGQQGIQWQGQRTLFDPVTNVRLGIAYLAELRARFGPWSTALAAYNWGPSKVGRRLRDGGQLPVIYSRKVLSAWERGRWEPAQRS